ncbi:hypothetical protein JUJ52_10440 [Virgibacillus sp. AGTR]|uniref:hypothetical protein n=1 Tax=Virgibacillus sp. AGTR TaxID=2812055 RepID=UPI001D168145|nr:hypothetical protein [Virgibacillus sp. AGTR]MCC2250383.1 hypothetical protein [Virgibacillus sp. AGTR]
MSLVMTIAMHDFVVMSSDLRAVHVEDEQIKKEGVRKVFRFNEKVVYGLTGDLDVFDDLNTHLSEHKSEKANVQAVSRIIRKYLRKRLDDNSEIQLRAHIAGIGDGNKVTIIELNHDDNYKQHKTLPGPEDAYWRTMYCRVPPMPKIEERFGELNDCTPESISALLREVNAEVAQEDGSVSEECEVEVV